MKTIFSSKWIRTAAAALALIAVTTGALAFAPSAVHAETNPPATPAAPKAKSGDKTGKLEQAYAKEQAALTQQADRLAKVNTAADKLSTLIDKAKSNGKDVSALEAALATFKGQVAKAHTAHDQAASILSTHSGFGTDGKVTDAVAARQTVASARTSLEDAHVILQQAVADLHATVRSWREANPPVKKNPQPKS